MDTGRDTGIAEVSIVATVQVAVLGFTDAQNHGSITTPVMRLPLASAWIATAVRPGELLPTAFAITSRVVESPLNFLRGELVASRQHYHL